MMITPFKRAGSCTVRLRLLFMAKVKRYDQYAAPKILSAREAEKVMKRGS